MASSSFFQSIVSDLGVQSGRELPRDSGRPQNETAYELQNRAQERVTDLSRVEWSPGRSLKTEAACLLLDLDRSFEEACSSGQDSWATYYEELARSIQELRSLFPSLWIGCHAEGATLPADHPLFFSFDTLREALGEIRLDFVAWPLNLLEPGAWLEENHPHPFSLHRVTPLQWASLHGLSVLHTRPFRGWATKRFVRLHEGFVGEDLPHPRVRARIQEVLGATLSRALELERSGQSDRPWAHQLWAKFGTTLDRRRVWGAFRELRSQDASWTPAYREALHALEISWKAWISETDQLGAENLSSFLPDSVGSLEEVAFALACSSRFGTSAGAPIPLLEMEDPTPKTSGGSLSTEEILLSMEGLQEWMELQEKSESAGSTERDSQ